MPPMGLDCSGRMFAIRDQDGNWHSLNGIPVIDVDDIVPTTDEEVKQYSFNPSDFSFSFTATIKRTRSWLKLAYTGRNLRRAIRRMEKERRKRLKEVSEDA